MVSRRIANRAVLLAVGAVMLIALIAVAWPRPSDGDVRQAYEQLRGAPVPVKVLGWVTPQAAQAEVRAEGYRLTVRDPVLGELTVMGGRGLSPQPGTAMHWRENDVDYVVTATADARLIEPRVVSLDEGARQLAMGNTDTPLLYLFYLPLLVGLGAWGAWSILSEPVDERHA